jgi:cell division septal protein FtsQ
VLGDSLLTVGDIEASLLTIPGLEKAKAVVRGDRTLIDITERTPVALINVGGFHLLDKSGVIFPVSSGVSYDIPLLTGVSKRDLADKGTVQLFLQQFQSLMSSAKALGGTFCSEISSVDMSDSAVVVVSFKANETMFALDARDIERRMGQLKVIKDRLKEEGAQPSHVNLCYRNFAFVTGSALPVKTDKVYAALD